MHDSGFSRTTEEADDPYQYEEHLNYFDRLVQTDTTVAPEPVRGVDYAGEAELYELIGALRDSRGLGVLLVSHDLHVVMARSDRVVCINGHVCCSGVPQTVARDPEYVRLFGAEAARAFALYTHDHDHRHDLHGTPSPAPSHSPQHRT